MNQMMPFQSLDYIKGNLFGNKLFQLPQHTLNGGFRFQNNGLFMLNHGYNSSMYPIQPIEQKEAFNLSYIDYSIKKGTINHIIGAFYIFSAQQDNKKETTEISKRVVKVNAVTIDDSREEKEKEPKKNLKENEEINFDNPIMIASQSPESIIFSPKKFIKQQDEKNGLSSFHSNINNPKEKDNEEMILNIINNPLKDVNIAGEQQLNAVNNIIKNIKENKISQIIEEEEKK